MPRVSQPQPQSQPLPLDGADPRRASAYQVYVRAQAKKYTQEFPPEIYLAWARLYQLRMPERGKPWLFRQLTREHVYYPLACSSGRVLQLLEALHDRDPRQRKLFQFLNDIGARALRMHLGRVLEMAEAAKTREQYLARFVERFGGQQAFDFDATRGA